MINYHELYQPAHNLIGAGCIRELPRYIKQYGGTHALIITDHFLAANGTVGKVTHYLDQVGLPYSIFDSVVPNPTTANVNDAVELCRKDQCDFLVAIGGGSPQDVAKATGILLTNGGEISAYAGVNRSEKPSLPLFAINTTAGTSSEATRAYVITDEKRKVKMLMIDANCLATAAFNDPLLMLEMPPALTAATGMDALTHAIEAYTSRSAIPYTNGLALEAIRLVAESLEVVVKNGGDIEARTNMCWAEYMAGLAFSNSGLGLVHAMAHQLGGFYGIAHGVANAMLLPHVMAYNATVAHERYGRVAQAMGVSTTGLTSHQAGDAAVRRVESLSKAVNIPKLSSTVFKISDVATLALHALEDAAMPENPRETMLVDVQQVFINAYEDR